MSPWKKPAAEDAIRVVYWAQLWRSDESLHGEVSTSLAFDTQAELTGWVRENRRDGDAIFPYRREQGKGGYQNVPLLVKEPPVDRDRLAALVSELAQRKDLQ